MSSIDSTAVSVAYPVIISYFNISLIVAGWVLSAYSLTLVTALPVAGKISDALGRKRTFMIFVSLFGIGSLLCSLAPNAPLLIFFRVLQGLGGSGLVPSATGIAVDQFPDSRPKAVGLVTSFFPIGMIVGPNLGGWLVSALGWRSIFWINIPICIAVLVVGALLMAPGDRKRSSFDLLGSGMLAVAILGIMGGVSIIGSGGPSWLLGIGPLVVGLTSLIFFWRRTKVVKNPVIEPQILREKPFLAANAYNFIFGSLVGTLTFIPLYAVSLYGMSTLQSGAIITPRSIGIMLASIVTSFFVVRWGYRRPMLIGTLLMLPCYALLALEPSGFSVLGAHISITVLLLIVLGLEGIFEGITLPSSNNACIELMPDRIATITSMRSMFRQEGSAAGITAGSIILNLAGIAPGFRIMLFGLVALGLLVMLPSIFAMPSGK